MGWHHIPEFDYSTADDNAFAGSKSQPTGKITVNLAMNGCAVKAILQGAQIPVANRGTSKSRILALIVYGMVYTLTT